MISHGGCRSDAILWQQWVRYTVRKVSIRIMMKLDKLKRQMLLQQVNYPARSTISGIYHDFKRLQAGSIDIGQQMLHISFGRIQWIPLSALSCWRKLILLSQLLDIEQASIPGNRTRFLTHEFHPVVILWVMTSSDGDTTIHTGMRCSEVYFFSTTQADIVHINALLEQALGHSGLNGFAGQTYVVPHNHLPGLDDVSVGAPDTTSNVVVELIWNSPTDIVSLKTGNFLHTALTYFGR